MFFGLLIFSGELLTRKLLILNKDVPPLAKDMEDRLS